MRVDSARHPQPRTGVGAAFAGAARTSSFDFTLTTADGDRVTLLDVDDRRAGRRCR